MEILYNYTCIDIEYICLLWKKKLSTILFYNQPTKIQSEEGTNRVQHPRLKFIPRKVSHLHRPVIWPVLRPQHRVWHGQECVLVGHIANGGYTDELIFCLQGGLKWKLCWWVCPREGQNDRRFMLWGGISFTGIKDLVVVNGKLTAARYIWIRSLIHTLFLSWMPMDLALCRNRITPALMLQM